MTITDSTTKPSDPIDIGRVTLMLGELRLPAIKAVWQQIDAVLKARAW